MASNVFSNVHPHFNPEEAAHTAVEFVSSLDNLPGEVTFLLEEISEKDKKINGLINRINTRHYGLTKNVKSLTNPSSASFPLPIPAGAPLPLDHLSSKDQVAMQKIHTEWVKVEQLQLEKIRLATRLEAVTSRARERGRAEWKRVGGMDLDEIEKAEGKAVFGEMGGAEVLLPPGGLGPGSDSRPYKKRKPNALPLPLPNAASTITHPPPAALSMMPPPPRPGPSARGTSRHNRQISTSTLSEDPDADADAEGEPAEGEGDEAADDTLYCFCQQKSYGEMIGCDNEECEYEWFHLKCVSLQTSPADTWYCPVCVQKLGLSSSDGTRAGQKKSTGRKR